MAHQSSDEQLLAGCLSGQDKEAWEIFVRRYSPLVWASIRKTFFSVHYQYAREDIEDVYSTVFLSLVDDNLRRLRLFEKRNACSLSTWLTIVGVRATLDYLRKQKKRYVINGEPYSKEPWQSVHEKGSAFEDVILEKEMEESLAKALSALSPKDRLIYELIYDKDTPPEEIAAITGLSVTAIYSRKSRIIGKLKKTVRDLQE
jgi:RNA polymerase sigma factor (sigma-70 family)